MTTRIALPDLARSIADSDDFSMMMPAIEKELLHYEIIQILDNARLLDRLVFQGDTCLRLCYGAERYSEDLDFVGGDDFDPNSLASLQNLFETQLVRHYDVEVEVKPPRESHVANDETEISVAVWQIRVTTAQARPDLPKQRISIQVAAVPAHTKTVRSLIVHYDGIPTSYADTLLYAETPEEICADKLKAFVTASNIRYRDIWDIRWLSCRAGFRKDKLPSLLAHKIADYHQEKGFRAGYHRVTEDLERIVQSEEFIQQMRRFLPAETIARTLERPMFREHIVESVRELYSIAT